MSTTHITPLVRKISDRCEYLDISCGQAAVYIPAIREPDLMVKMADFIHHEWSEIAAWVQRTANSARVQEEAVTVTAG